MAREIFVVLNASTNELELRDFGILLPADVSIDLYQYDKSISSLGVDNYLLNGDLVRLINGSAVSYEEAFLSQAEPLQNVVLDASVSLMSQIFEDTRSPNGFVNKDLDSIISVDDLTGVFTIQPIDSSIPIYVKGVKHHITDSSVFIGTEGFHYLYIDPSTLKIADNSTYSDDLLYEVITSMVYWDDTNNKAIWVSNQRHGIVMDDDTHHWIHSTQGIGYKSGGIFYDFSIGDVVIGVSDEEAQFSVTDLHLYDEDLESEIRNGIEQILTPFTGPIYYIAGPGVFRRDNSTNILAKSFSGGNGRLAYSRLDPSFGYVQTEVQNDWYVITHILYVDDINSPIAAFQGTNEYETITAAKNAAIGELQILSSGNTPNNEWKALGSVIFQTSNTYSNTKLARIVRPEAGSDYIKLVTLDILRGDIPDHGFLFGLNDDDHPQYALLEGRSEDVLKIDKIIPFSLQGIDVSGYQINNVGNPTNGGDAINKLYFDASLATKASLNYVNSTFLRESSLGTDFYFDGGILNVSTGISGVSQAYVDGSLAARDVSIQWLVDNTYDRIYIDGSLNLKADITYVDNNFTTFTYVDGSLAHRDASITFIFNNFTTKNYVDTKNFQQDGSITFLFNNKANKIDVESSLGFIWNELDNKTSFTYVDGSLAFRDLRLNTLDGSVQWLVDQNYLRESSLGTDFYWNGNVIDLSTAFKNKIANSSSEGYQPFYFKSTALSTNFLRTLKSQNGLIIYGDGSTSTLDSSIYIPGAITATGQSYQGNIVNHFQTNYLIAQKIREKSNKNAAFSGNTGVTQLAPYDVSAELQGNWYPWGTYNWNSSGSTIEFVDWIIFFSDIQENLLVNLTYDASSEVNGAYGLYINHTNRVPGIEIVTNLNRISYSDKSYIGIIRVKDGSITNFGPSPDVYATDRFKRDTESFASIEYEGLILSADSSSSFTSTAGKYSIEGSNWTAWNYFNDTYTGSQYIRLINAQNPVIFIETEPETGIDSSIAPYSDFRLYSNRYWDVSTFIDSSISGKYIISAIYVTFTGLREVRRGSVLYDDILSAESGITDFEFNSAPLPDLFKKSFPLVNYIIAQTDASDLSNTNQVQIFVPTSGGSASGGGGGGGIIGAENIGDGEEIFAGTINNILQFRTLESLSSELILSTTSSHVTFDTSIRNYDSSINQLWNYNYAQDASIATLDGSVAYLFTLPSFFTTFEYVDGSLAARDVSIAWLANNTHTRTYIDGSLNNRTSFTYVDGSLAARDTSIAWLNTNKLEGTGVIGTHNTVAYWDGPKSLTYDSLFVWDPTNNRLGIGVSEFTLGDEEKLLIDSGITSEVTIARIQAQIDDYLQLEIKNNSGGPNASADLVISSNISTEDTGYIDLGINSPTYNLNYIGTAYDAYLFSSAANLIIANSSIGQDIVFSTESTDVYTNEKLRIRYDGNILIGKPTSEIYKLEVNGDVNIPTGFDYRINGIPLYSNTYIDESLNNRVRRTGDTMTGRLNITSGGLTVNNDVSIGGDVSIGSNLNVKNKIHLETYTGATVDNDLWVDSSGHLNFRHGITPMEASTYDLTDRLLRTANDWSFFPDTSTLGDNDRILIEDSEDGYKKKWISKSALGTAVTGGFGEYVDYIEDPNTTSTTSTTFITKLTLVTDSSAIAGTYRVAWGLQISNSNNSKESAYQITVDGSIIGSNIIYFNAGTVFWSFPGFVHLPLSAGAHTIRIDYRAVTNTASIRNTALEFWRV